jgi:hypothetical protein
MIDRRGEQRIPVCLKVRIWGIDNAGTRFEQEAVARNISSNGALLSGINQALRAKDLVVVQYRANKASFRVVWTRPSGDDRRIIAAVQRREADECPWGELLPDYAATRS